MMLREADRIMPGLHFDHVVNFSGYEAFIAKFLGALTLRGSRMHTWVHNDMAREQELRRNFNEQILMEAYQRSTTIDVVSEPVAARLVDGYFPPDVLPRVRVVHNTADSAKVRSMARAEVTYLSAEQTRVLDDPTITKFVTIGRFSPEKDHLRLVEAFEAVSARYSDRPTALFLIGGPGNSREMLLARISSSPFSDRIHVFEGVNPHPVLSRCDLFVLSSHYEGLPMVFFEALALDVPILSTAIPGPKEFLSAGYGSTCPDSTEGLIGGMSAFMDATLPGRTRSLADFNSQAVAEFEALFTQS
jgi:CDP-glycerol glycerophosphotransferase